MVCLLNIFVRSGGITQEVGVVVVVKSVKKIICIMYVYYYRYMHALYILYRSIFHSFMVCLFVVLGLLAKQSPTRGPPCVTNESVLLFLIVCCCWLAVPKSKGAVAMSCTSRQLPRFGEEGRKYNKYVPASA